MVQPTAIEPIKTIEQHKLYIRLWRKDEPRSYGVIVPEFQSLWNGERAALIALSPQLSNEEYEAIRSELISEYAKARLPLTCIIRANIEVLEVSV